MKILNKSELSYKNGEWRKGVKLLLATANSNNWNQTLGWVPGDTPADFELSQEVNTPCKEMYIKNPISYKLNNLGWRTNDDFIEDDEPGNLFLGCSHTFGQGHHLEATWAYKVNEHVGGKFYNVGWPGSSLTTEYRKLKIALRTYNIKNVFCFLPHYTRYEIYNPFGGKDGAYEIHNPAWDRPLSKVWTKVLSMEENYNMLSDAIINAMIYKCNEFNVPLYTMDGYTTHLLQTQKKFSMPKCPCGGHWDYKNKGPHDARDNHHPACIHEFVGDRYIKQYNAKNTPKFLKMDSYV